MIRFDDGQVEFSYLPDHLKLFMSTKFKINFGKFNITPTQRCYVSDLEDRLPRRQQIFRTTRRQTGTTTFALLYTVYQAMFQVNTVVLYVQYQSGMDTGINLIPDILDAMPLVVDRSITRTKSSISIKFKLATETQYKHIHIKLARTANVTDARGIINCAIIADVNSNTALLNEHIINTMHSMHNMQYVTMFIEDF